ncbi:pantoate--beta-alanine ligase [Granulicella aggregans]|uniref:Pantothenate synthetase n=1 Tax=Granulicella aggregans TaxID=474949 RepID=A0A7W7ZAY9_9BACT|nr:pantoate--beta-alanine ligase [Granulicella aggregans]MBB5056452.1 pantoate--beta-alanine ligase [Granulicella aggregans]
MQIIKTVEEMQRVARGLGRKGTLGLVPTMGALHEGHLSLVRRARSECDAVVATIFVNPLQFGANEDLDKYPRTFEADCEQLDGERVDILFAPAPEEMYRPGATTTVDVGAVGARLDGASRPGHFMGVATVVAKLFHIAMPDRAYFGQKDAAQLAVIRQMARDLNFCLEVVGCPIVRDEDGLALSSRNRYLTAEERNRALILPRTLAAIEEQIRAGVRDSELLTNSQVPELEATSDIAFDYLAIVDPDTLLPEAEAVPGTLIAIAAKVGNTRLIDNLIVG